MTEDFGDGFCHSAIIYAFHSEEILLELFYNEMD